MRISEPMTMLTDWLMAACCFFWSWRLFALSGQNGQDSTWYWGGAFLGTALASLVGGARHGLANYLDPRARALLVQGVLFFLGGATFCLINGVNAASLAGHRASLVWVFNGLLFYTYLLFLTVMKDYRFEVMYYLLALGAAGALQSHNETILVSVSVSGLGIILWLFKVSPHRNFNHNDLFHVIQCVALWFLYRGGLAFKDIVQN